MRNSKEVSSARVKVWVLQFVVRNKTRSHRKILNRGVVRSNLQRYGVTLAADRHRTGAQGLVRLLQ